MRDQRSDQSPVPRVGVYKGKILGDVTVAAFMCDHRATAKKKTFLHRWQDLQGPQPPDFLLGLFFNALRPDWLIKRLDVFMHCPRPVSDKLWNTECVYEFLMTPRGTALLLTQFERPVSHEAAAQVLGGDFESMVLSQDGYPHPGTY